MIRMISQSLWIFGGTILRVSLVLGLLLTSQVATGQRLCVGSEGHIALESVAHGSCADKQVLAEHHVDCEDDTGHSHLTEDHCGNCIDITMDGQFVSLCLRPVGSKVGHLVRLTDTLATLDFVSNTNAVSIAPGGTFGLSRPPLAEMRCLRSTVLQI